MRPLALTSTQLGWVLRSLLDSSSDVPECLQQRAARVQAPSALLLHARTQGVEAFLLRRLEDAGVPWSTSRQGWGSELAHGRLGFERAMDAVGQVAHALQAASIQCVPLKGPVLAARVYPEPCSRAFTDLDWLIPREATSEAIGALRAMGYRLLSERWHQAELRWSHDVALRHPTLPQVELHFEASRGFGRPLPSEPLLARALPYEHPRAGKLRVLSGEDELLYLAVHAASHGFSRLGWLLDMKLLLGRLREQGALPASEELVARAAQWRVARAWERACYELARQLGCSGLSSPQLSEATLRRLSRGLLRGASEESSLAESLAQALFTSELADSASLRARHLLQKVRGDLRLRREAARVKRAYSESELPEPTATSRVVERQ